MCIRSFRTSRTGAICFFYALAQPNSTTENNGAQELVANALALGAPAIVLHFNNAGWRLAHQMISELQDQGHNIWGEIYPYAAGSTTLNASFLEPESWVEELGNRYEDTLQDPSTGKFYTLETYKADVATNPTKQIVVFKQPAENAPKWLTLKGVTMASDAVAPEPTSAHGIFRWKSSATPTPARLAPVAKRCGSVGKTTSR